MFFLQVVNALAAPSALVGDDTLFHAIVGTAGGLSIGSALATLIGCSFGILVGLSPRFRNHIKPHLEFLRPLPASASVSAAILILGRTRTMIVFMIAFGRLGSAPILDRQWKKFSNCS